MKMWYWLCENGDLMLGVWSWACNFGGPGSGDVMLSVWNGDVGGACCRRWRGKAAAA